MYLVAVKFEITLYLDWNRVIASVTISILVCNRSGKNSKIFTDFTF